MTRNFKKISRKFVPFKMLLFYSGPKSIIMQMTIKRTDKILTEITEILKKSLDPSKIILFGSRAKNINDPHADFDIAVSIKRPSISEERKIKEEIEKVSGLYKVDIIYMPSVDKDFKNIIIKTGKVLYERRA